MTGAVEVHGRRIAFRAWGKDSDLPGVILVHGGMAHSHWWDHIAPALATDRRVVAVDLSGHGDSDNAPHYSLSDWAEEIIAVRTAGGIKHRPIVVGHSMGGIVAFAASHHFAEQLGGVVLVDARIYDWSPQEREHRTMSAANPRARTYPTKSHAISRFRITPPQDHCDPEILAHIAETSVINGSSGWTWKFDPDRMTKETRESVSDMTSRCPVRYLRCEKGVVPEPMIDIMTDRFGDDFTVAEIPKSSHHPMLDNPEGLVVALETAIISIPYELFDRF